MSEPLSRRELLKELRESGFISAEKEVEALSYFRDLSPIVGVPWFVMVLQGLGGWISASLVLFSVFLFFGDSMGVIGVPICGAGIWLERHAKGSAFWGQVTLSLMLIGSGLGIYFTGSSLVDYFGNSHGHSAQLWSVAFVLVPSVIVYLTRNWLVRSIMLTSSFIATIFGVSKLLPEPYFEVGASLGLMLCMASWLWVMMDEVRFRQRLHDLYGPLVVSLLCAAVIGLVIEQEIRDGSLGSTQHLWVTAIGLFVLMSWVLHRVRLDMGDIFLNTSPLVTQVSGGLIAVALSFAPGALFSLILGLVGMRARRRGLVGLALILLSAFLGKFYYALEYSLVFKSGTLFIAGAVMLFLGRRFHRVSV